MDVKSSDCSPQRKSAEYQESSSEDEDTENPAKRFFSQEEWRKMGTYERQVCKRKFENYSSGKAAGISMQLPLFMTPREQKINWCSTREKGKAKSRKKADNSDDESTPPGKGSAPPKSTRRRGEAATPMRMADNSDDESTPPGKMDLAPPQDKVLHQCSQCPRTYKSRCALNRHEKQHVRGRIHLCHLCGQLFLQWNALARHLLTHTGEKVPCDKCGKKVSGHRLRLHKKGKGCVVIQ